MKTRVQAETLSDGSKVYDVVIESDDGRTVVLHAYNDKTAERLNELIGDTYGFVVGVEVRP